MFIKTLISFIICVFLSLSYFINCSIGSCSVVQCSVRSQNFFYDADNQEITQLIKQAVEYEWWTEGTHYRVELSKLFASPTLEKITKQVEQYRETSTDWYSLTFLENCHIVYNNGNIAIAIAYLTETDVITHSVQTGRGVFILNKINEGWRIKEMDCYWYHDNNHPLSREVTNL
ncbi:hypothetical protein [Desulfoscipio gibsoniae]|uniref:SnoaL-like domain-containing protein n=1 Tax=Desulfoscipio gibsoniae DSM 7213 TaxID=767817 RepID=R4KP71_9FIRM|nr:hypothetical protein [Desulfoscipio gibsoniae]AGL01431.1 hypothetical protein Desgi_1987 [Desulfoscipio gibsoniae DSM 7213]